MAEGQAVVTGTAGFVGSHLAEALLAEGWSVRGVDCFTDYYGVDLKWANLADLAGEPHFTLVEADLATDDLGAVLDGADVVFHLAGQPGVRKSWGPDFADYVRNNVDATQRLLEALRGRGVRVVNSSSSSVYGSAEIRPTPETCLPQPVSPYGVTKLAAEHLCRLYAEEAAVDTVSLRYFTVYGPRQRPDMAFRRFLEAAAADAAITLYGTGEQSRDFTYVADAVEANLRAARDGASGAVYNIGGGGAASMNAVIDLMGDITGRPLRVDRRERQAGDAAHTGADITAATRDLGFRPAVGLEEGIRRQWEWVAAGAVAACPQGA